MYPTSISKCFNLVFKAFKLYLLKIIFCALETRIGIMRKRGIIIITRNRNFQKNRVWGKK